MYRLTTESRRASRTMLSNSQTIIFIFQTNWSNILFSSVTLVRACLSYTFLVLPVGSALEPECEALRNIGYRARDVPPNGLVSRARTLELGIFLSLGRHHWVSFLPRKSESESQIPFF